MKETNWEIEYVYVSISQRLNKETSHPSSSVKDDNMFTDRVSSLLPWFSVLDDKEDIFDHSDALQVSEDTSESVIIKIF